jgi:S-DNA-T family DNA segregation ATPase FtsK/SpoIIIE
MGKKSSTRPPKKKNQPSHKLRSALLGFVSFALSIIIVSYDRYDPMRNFLGYAGFLVGFLFFYLLGLCTYLIPPYLGWLAIQIFQKKPIPLRHWLYFGGLVISGSVVLSMLSHAFPVLAQAFDQTVFSENFPNRFDPTHLRHYLGGVPAYHIYIDTTVNLRQVFGSLGCFIIFAGGFLALLWLLFPQSFVGILEKIGPVWEASSQRPIFKPTVSKPFATLEIENLPPLNRPTLREDPMKKTAQIKLIDEEPVSGEDEDDFEPITNYANPSLDGYELPSAQLLTQVEPIDQSQLKQDLKRQAQVLEETLASFGIEAKVGDIHCGPTITSFEVHPAFGVKVQKIKALENDLALNMQAKSIRIIAPIPGKAVVGIEVPNPFPQEVSFRELLENYRGKAQIPLLLGKKVNGEDVMADLTKMPHLIIAGATGSGKSVCINTIVMSILMTSRPDEIKLVMVDPKKVELTSYTHLPHMLAPVITEPAGALSALNWLVKEMERRYEIFRQLGIRNISGFNSRVRNVELENSLELDITEKLPYIVVIIDELADLMIVASSDIETPIARIAQMARAVGIHLILATQRPSREVITGLIKANFPTRIAFKVSSRVNSQIIIDENGAETLLGNGDMLFMPPGSSNLIRAQGAFIRDEDIQKVISFIGKQASTSYVIPNFEHFRDPLDENASASDSGAHDKLFEEAKKLVLETGTASTTFVQRKLKVGYARAASLMDQLEAAGIVGPSEGAKPRKIFYPMRSEEE